MKNIVIYIKTSIFVVLCTLLYNNSYGQNFAPIGSIWTYENLGDPIDLNPIATQFKVLRDTVIEGIICSVIEGYEVYTDRDNALIGEEIVYGNRDSVFVYSNSNFNLIFDFTAKAGDTIRVITQPFDAFFISESFTIDSFSYIIDSVMSMTVGNEELILQKVSYVGDPYLNTLQWGFMNDYDLSIEREGYILQSVGSLGRESMLGTSPDFNYIGGVLLDRLSCFQTSSSIFEFSSNQCDILIDEVISSNSGPNQDNLKISVYPNPTKDLLHISSLNQFNIQSYKIENLSGQIMLSEKMIYNSIDISYLRPGIYFLTITDTLKNKCVVSVIKI